MIKIAAMRNLLRDYRIVTSLLFIIVYFALTVGLPSIVGDAWAENSIQFGIVLSAVIGIFVFNGPIIQGFHNLKGKYRKLALVIVGFLFFQTIAITISTQFIDGIGGSENQAAVEGSLKGAGGVLATLVLALFAPIVEELVFREALIGWAKSKVIVAVMAVISGVTFLYFHAPFDPAGIAFYLPGTISLIAIYLIFRKNIAASMVAHIVFNTVAAISTFAA
ncbi:CPBP family intramembrane metalloprotease [Corynebacterium pseudotuberculosis]|uniref:CPBP family intramembrane glutamic endopeptidase n=1 Tax=Corynebacterium pseudotuberculosis TaxID=1719 RepID=UPI0006BB6499|nr:CAAX protease [Corynebacterium pseudotuberculosis]ANH26410.1 Caax amino protease [Corynebacterium pseudotuberculosis]APZ32364.1 Caax amino protease [Corynebacterium pseudotuberculosis]QGX59648.1 CPBP family intramembrane metalloprotease [Corynebacterium pseudotuberculosis]